MTTIYVGNLPFSATEAEVRTLFEQHGKGRFGQTSQRSRNRPPTRLRFVDMPSADAQKAIGALNGFDMGGRPLRINEAREREARGPRPAGKW